MKIYKKVKRITNKLAQVHYLIEQLETEIECDGIDWSTARLVSGLKEKPDGLYQDGVMIAEWADECYVNQSQGYLEDDYYGHLYFKTDVPGQFVKVWFDC